MNFSNNQISNIKINKHKNQNADDEAVGNEDANDEGGNDEDTNDEAPSDDDVVMRNANFIDPSSERVHRSSCLNMKIVLWLVVRFL